MLFEHVKKRIIKGLISEIQELGPTELELVGHRLLEIVEGKMLVHHGLNKDYKPSGYTVDTFSADSTVVGEYSTLKDYFEDTAKKGESAFFEKIENDINHALAHKKPNGPEKIYLICSLEEPPSFRAKFNATAIAQTYGNKVTIYDAREVAKLIYDQSIENAGVGAFFRDFLPDFALNLDNYEYYGKIPAACENHKSDDFFLQRINEHYAKGQSICVLSGLSGCGKTQAAIDFVRRHGDAFENYLWIAGDDWKADTPLSAIQRSRGGFPINIAGIFNASRTLLIIDNLNRALDLPGLKELSAGYARGSVILVTSQVSSPRDDLYLPLPVISEEVALSILGETPGNASELCVRFMRACRFSPLILATTRKIAEQNDLSKEDLYNEVLSMPGDIAQTDGTSIMQRILGRLNGPYLDGLKKIADSCTTMHDASFLNHFLGANVRIGLQRLSMLQPATAPGVLAVHDLICKAVQTTPNCQAIGNALETYIEKHGGEMIPSVLREIHLCAEQLVALHELRGSRVPDWVTYALLQIDSIRPRIHHELYQKTISATSAIAEVLCIIDSKETHAYTIGDHQSRQDYYSSCAEEYRNVLALLTTEQLQIKAELLHHRGKALRRSDDLDAALSSFKEALQIFPEWHATHGQIAHLGTQYKASEEVKREGEAAMTYLLDCMLEDSSRVPLRVSLGAFARLRSYQALSAPLQSKPESVGKLADVIAMSALEGLDQFYEAFLSFTSMFGYRHPAVCVNLAETLPETLAIPPSEIEKKQWASACECFTNTSTAAAREGKDELRVRIAHAAVEFAASIESSGEVNAFVARVIAKAYLAADMPQKAIDRIEKVSSPDHWILYLRSKAEQAIGSHDYALASARLAFDGAKLDPKATSRLSIYHDQLSKSYEGMVDLPSAKSEAEQAIATCTDEQYKRELTERLAQLEALLGKPN